MICSVILTGDILTLFLNILSARKWSFQKGKALFTGFKSLGKYPSDMVRGRRFY
jgi:hypothetical protein